MLWLTGKVLSPPSPPPVIGLGQHHSILAPPIEFGLCSSSPEEQEETGLEQGEGLMPPVTGNKVLARAELPNPMPVPVAMGNKEEWLRKREEGRPAPWPPEPPINTLLLPSRLEMGSWPPLAARAVKETQYYSQTSTKLTCYALNRMY